MSLFFLLRVGRFGREVLVLLETLYIRSDKPSIGYLTFLFKRSPNHPQATRLPFRAALVPRAPTSCL